LISITSTPSGGVNLYNLLNIKIPETIAQFKNVLKLVIQSFGSWYVDPDHLPLPSMPLQIESEFKLSEPDSTLANTDINRTGTDPISKLFFGEIAGASWLHPNRVPPFPTDEVTIEEEENWEWHSGYFSYWKNSQAFKRNALKAGASKFVKYEMRHREAFPCEGRIYHNDYFSWVLKDGSVFDYIPMSECD